MTAQGRIALALLAAATLLCGLFFLVGYNEANPVERSRAYAIAGMAAALLLIWVWLGGALMFALRHRVRALVLKVPLDWRLKFILFATLLACTEEGVTVSLTNLAPWFGVPLGVAFVTASANYHDVIVFHSVVMFIPFFITLALVLQRWDFSPFAVLVAFGLVGTTAEAIFAASPVTFVMFPLWCFVYGLMVWLPAFCLPPRPLRRAGAVLHLLLPPTILILSLPMIVPLVWLISVRLGHPSIHFPPFP